MGATYLTDPKTTAEGFTQARLDGLAPAHIVLRTAQQQFLDADQTRQQGTRARLLAYNALNTRCARLCARSYDHYAEHNATTANAYVRDPAPGAATPATV